MRYRRRVAEVEAAQFSAYHPLAIEGVEQAQSSESHGGGVVYFARDVLGQAHVLWHGAWVVRHPGGGLEVLGAEAFAGLYEPIP